MRSGLIVSSFAHLAIVGWGFVALPDADSFETDPVNVLPVELVTISAKTDLQKGVEKIPEEPKPIDPVVKKPTPTTSPSIDKTVSTAPKIGEAEKEKKAIKAPAEPVKMAPKPDQVAVLVEKSEPEPAPVPKIEPKPVINTAKLSKILPRSKPRPKKPVKPVQQAERVEKVEAVQETRDPAPLQKTETARKMQKPTVSGFNADEIAALLNKSGSAEPEKPRPIQLGVNDGVQDAPMTQSEIDMLRARLAECWVLPAGAQDAENLRVIVRILLNENGGLSAPPAVMNSGFGPFFVPAAESALRAVHECAPFDFLPREKYAQWSEINFHFDPKEMFGG